MVGSALPFWLEILALPGLAALAYLAGRRNGRASGRSEGEETDILTRLESLERARASAELANQELRRALEEFERLAGTDRLTGAWNRRRLEEGAMAFMALAIRKQDPLSAIFFDLDHFKRINDQFGHGAGDHVLVEVVRITRSHLRNSDFLARWGGEEFMILANGTTLAGAAVLAEKIRSAVEAAAHPEIGSITISAGVAEFHPDELMEHWMHRADTALYLAKESGRNQVALAPPPVDLPPPAPPPLFHLVWDERYASGHPGIDAQHRRLFDLSNKLLSQSQANGQPHRESLQLLLAHVAQHFHDEEAVLAQLGFPDLRQHAQAHSQLLHRTRAILDDPSWLDLPRLAGFLAFDLIKGHILEEDRHYFRSLAGRS